MTNYSVNIGNRARDLMACSTVRRPTAPPAACPLHEVMHRFLYINSVRGFFFCYLGLFIFYLFSCHELVRIITLILINIREIMKKDRLKNKQKLV